MRENRPYGSEGGEAKPFPTPIWSGGCNCLRLRLTAPTVVMDSGLGTSNCV